MTETTINKRQAIEAQCWHCLGYYSDGKQDCENVKCPLYTYMPYRKLEPDLWWERYYSRRVGKQLKLAYQTAEEQERYRETHRHILGQKRSRLLSYTPETEVD